MPMTRPRRFPELVDHRRAARSTMPADAWGYSYGAAANGRNRGGRLRGGFFDLSRVPNGKTLEPASAIRARSRKRRTSSARGHAARSSCCGFPQPRPHGRITPTRNSRRRSARPPTTRWYGNSASRPGRGAQCRAGDWPTTGHLCTRELQRRQQGGLRIHRDQPLASRGPVAQGKRVGFAPMTASA